MNRQKIVNIGQGRLNASCKRLVVLCTQQRIQPYDAVTIPFQTCHLAVQQFYVATVPAIADDQHDRAATEHAASPFEVEIFKRLANARAAGPIIDELAYVFESQVQVTDLQRARDARQARAADKRLYGLSQGGLHPINKMQ